MKFKRLYRRAASHLCLLLQSQFVRSDLVFVERTIRWTVKIIITHHNVSVCFRMTVIKLQWIWFLLMSAKSTLTVQRIEYSWVWMVRVKNDLGGYIKSNRSERDGWLTNRTKENPEKILWLTFRINMIENNNNSNTYSCWSFDANR